MTERPSADQLVRVYPQRVAGTPTAWAWDRTTHVFSLSFDTKAGVGGTTDIFVPSERFFPIGFDVMVDDPTGTWTQTWDATRHVVSITTSAALPSHVVTIRSR